MTDHPYLAGLIAAAEGTPMHIGVRDYFGSYSGPRPGTPELEEYVDGFAGGLVAITQGAFTS